MQVVQLYEVVRTAHLERNAGCEHVVLLYREKRYDFDAAVARGVTIVRRGRLGAAVYALRNPIDIIEVNEPLVVRAAVRSVLFILAARCRARVLGEGRPLTVAYAIANMPSERMLRNLPWRAALKYRAQRALTPTVWRLLDRVAFGTSEAQELYQQEYGPQGAAPLQRVVEALPAPRADLSGAPRAPQILFLGDLSERKGFPDVVRAWGRVREMEPAASLTIMGRGAGASEASRLAAEDDRVTTLLDPTRDQILAALIEAKVLVLPSRRRPLWKEQVGLPLVEGLAAGCVIVTTAETGISGWLAEHGHWVLEEDRLDDTLAPALTAAVRLERTPAELATALPGHDGRDKARQWMYDSSEGVDLWRKRASSGV